MEEDKKMHLLDDKYFSEEVIQEAKKAIYSCADKNQKEKDSDDETNDQKDINEFYDHFGKLKKENVPIVYSSNYDISFMGLEKFHPFDACKYSKVANYLDSWGVTKLKNLINPLHKPTRKHLLAVHTEAYLDSLKLSSTVAHITELYFLSALPHFLIQNQVLNPFLFATSGTILAGQVAMQRGWAINIGGGFHHCCYNEGGGFCAYADITLSYRFVRKYYPKVKRVMIVDLDAHQGNGHENDKLHFKDEDLFILDMFNPKIYPGDEPAKAAINIKINAYSGIEDESYLSKLKDGLNRAFNEFSPDLVIYNAGTDILEGDPLGCMSVSSDGVMKRDAMVFGFALKNNVPIIMVLSGGYQPTNAMVIANSISNLNKTYSLIDKFGMDGQKIVKMERCKKCSIEYDPEKNIKGVCAHTKEWHSGYSDCNYFKCAFGLGPSGISLQHWGCCFITNKEQLKCPKSDVHVPTPN